jgi:uncharacterized protein (TIGR00369 family)
MGITLTEATAERTAATMPVPGNRQRMGILHGGASALLAETVGSVAASLHAGDSRFIVGLELNITHHRSATDGVITAVATPLALGNTIASYQIELTNDHGQRISTARLTCLVRERR